jgi:SAM-dependent methyltransferase
MSREYGFNPASTDEERRLSLLEHLCDPATTDLLTRTGVSTGWHCLEIGAGSGSVARWLRDKVQPGGRVVAVDLDTRFIEGEPGIEARQADLLVDDLTQLGAFDLVHCRALLHHLPGNQVEALRRMMSTLRPGALLIAEEPYFGSMFASTTAAWVEIWRNFCAAMPNADYEWAIGLAAALQAAGLKDIEGSGRADVVQGSSRHAEFLLLSLEAVQDRLPPGTDMEAATGLLRDPAVFEPGVVWYAAWGRTPG